MYMSDCPVRDAECYQDRMMEEAQREDERAEELSLKMRVIAKKCLLLSEHLEGVNCSLRDDFSFVERELEAIEKHLENLWGEE